MAIDYELRKHQKESVEAAIKGLEKSKYKPRPIIVQAPTAFGKSLVIAELAKRLGSVLVLAPSKEITEQNYSKLIAMGIPRGDIRICSASLKSHEIGKITLGTIGTVCKYPEKLNHINAVIIDEAHVVCCDRADSQYIKFLDALKTNNIIGLTATPWRNCVFAARFEDPRVYCRPLTLVHMAGGKSTRFGEWFWSGGIVYRCPIKYLQEEGYLAPTHYIVQSTDWSFLPDVPGRVDYDTEMMSKWMDFESNTNIFNRALKWMTTNYEKSIVFAPDIDTSRRLCNIALAMGIKADTIDSKNDNAAARNAKLERFRNGGLQVMFNVGVLTTGYDLPSLDCVMLCRPTKSLSLYLQMVGRSIRIDPKNPAKVAQIIDMSDNVFRFGAVEDVLITPREAVNKSGFKYMRETIWVTPPDAKRPKIFDRVS